MLPWRYRVSPTGLSGRARWKSRLAGRRFITRKTERKAAAQRGADRFRSPGAESAKPLGDRLRAIDPAPLRVSPPHYRGQTEDTGMRRPTSIAPPKGTLGVLTPGMGAVSTTFMAGVELVRKGSAAPIGSMTQLGTIRLGKRTQHRSPLIREFVPLQTLDNLVFGGSDIFPHTAYEAAVKAGVLEPLHLEEVKGLLGSIRPMTAAVDQAYVKRLNRTAVKHAKTKFDLAQQIKDDIQHFKKETGV